ncbi:hypothetical protein P608_15945 [Comamonas thiooxydans]|uniref:Uncharacterized protein n=2 Tax=Burkholderiales TaxID=80840 RepID=A0A0E3BYW2_9BURK|nr:MULTISPECIES: hypothetical protein [Pseudomonadota]MDN4681597.1 hypothetical protein [Pseudomonas aeruginosa]KGH10015.1 hypothetical protein P608_15945 [Comamonas thiooxydans]KGH15676.1 hypothetical protein P607_21270 [Comamonas thiooxydans]MCD0497194.1 hypothetical protein [Achromobacter sp. MY14]MDP5439794.1 hypothetical protein [Pseudomonas aeruginosa]
MTKKSTLATTATIALLSSFAIMILLHTYGPGRAFMMQSAFDTMHPMSGIWHGMGWMMVFGPLAMILFFGGVVTLAVLFVRFLTGRS